MQFDFSLIQRFIGNKFVQLIAVLTGLSLVLLISWKVVNYLNNYQASVLPDSDRGKATIFGQSIVVEAIEIEEDATPTEVQRATQYADLRASLPVNQDGFTVTYSYKNDKFQVQLQRGREQQFQTWRRQNFNLLQLEDFEISAI